jgi:hypothetical protein
MNSYVLCAAVLLLIAQADAEGSMRAKAVFLQPAPANRSSLDSGPINAGDLVITGVTMTGTNAGYVYVDDDITCTGYSSPPPDPSSYYWSDPKNGQVIQTQTIDFPSAGIATIICRASNVYNGVTYTATTSPLDIIVCNLGVICHGPTGAANNTQASIILIAFLIFLLRFY